MSPYSVEPPPGPGAPDTAVVRQAAGARDSGSIAFSAFRGHFSDNPRAVYEELLRRSPDLDAWWVDEGVREFPPGIRTLTPGTAAYHSALGRARFVVANDLMPQLLPKRGRTYLQTWHGTPLKRIAWDNPAKIAKRDEMAAAVRDYAQWDFLVTQNRYSTEVLTRAFRFEGEVLETGYPRNDVLCSPEAPDVRRRVRASLGLDEATTVVLYAPTFRDARLRPDGRYDAEVGLDVARLREALGPDVVVLLRMHYWVSLDSVPRSDAWRDVSRHPDIRELYLAADALVTDYSSVMFDFAVTRKPIVLLAYDLEAYRSTMRGHYFDITERAPGPVCGSTDEVAEQLGDLAGLLRRSSPAYDEFRAEFCSLDDGHASARVVDRVFGPAASAGLHPG